jgi:hypothetical protein
MSNNDNLMTILHQAQSERDIRLYITTRADGAGDRCQYIEHVASGP